MVLTQHEERCGPRWLIQKLLFAFERSTLSLRCVLPAATATLKGMEPSAVAQQHLGLPQERHPA